MNDGLEGIDVNTVGDYKELVGLKNTDKENFSAAEKTKLNKLLEIARAQKNFEIELYWKRALYFWGFIVAIYTAFFAVFTAGQDSSLLKSFILTVLSFLGYIFCLGFYYSNIGSKQWQENWEWHVSVLEWIEGSKKDDKKVGKKDDKKRDKKNDDIKDGGGLFNLFKRDKKTNFSVTGINKVLCKVLYVVSAGFFLFCFCNFVLQINLNFLRNLIDILKENSSKLKLAVGIILGILVIVCYRSFFMSKTRGNKIDKDDKNFACFVINKEDD